MDYKVIKYRTKHKKCKYCKYYKACEDTVGFDYYNYSMCALKDRALSFPNLRNLCKYYEVNTKEINNVKDKTIIL